MKKNLAYFSVIGCIMKNVSAMRVCACVPWHCDSSPSRGERYNDMICTQCFKNELGMSPTIPVFFPNTHPSQESQVARALNVNICLLNDLNFTPHAWENR